MFILKLFVEREIEMRNCVLKLFRLWQEVGFTAPEQFCSALLEDVVHDVEVIRKAAAPALAVAIKEHPDVAPAILQQLVDLYDGKLKVRSVKG